MTQFRVRGEKDRIFSKGVKAEIVYVIISKGIPLFRTEGVGDISTISVVINKENYELPVILPEKIQAKLRRVMLEKLRDEYAKFDDEFKKKILDTAKNLGYKRTGDGWNCYIAPPQERKSSTDIGMCGYCPSCTILGNITDDSMMNDINTAYGIKSRVAHDIAFSLVEYKKAIMELTHNKVADGVSYTGQSLYSELHIAPGVVFIGKSTAYDLTKNEFEVVLDALASITRLGGGETKYGSVETRILSVKFSEKETISSYDIMREIVGKHKGEMMDPEDYVREVSDILKGKGFTDYSYQVNYKEAWEDSLDYAGKIREFINIVENKTGGKEKKKGKSSGGEE
ncbi:type I-D CRISPR-associated protein Cas7/Csc2 [Acidianus infernus]|uniref:Type I-D CRISPR-associated protein Cas7/Csc2 n=1 Tax=Acidianus infernus TaxID=12915 RepID=A0A6A9QPZ9_ACIIN|nr:type I-D CRISPR-associated protein Cas7/Csc2 [Acidianus infernus]MUM65968.1 type I-D CRISPR-associated protein Cas7/Csc2 [Acidianus infernus]